jgi:hydrogenase/urease accessory protein HupE
MIRTKQLTATLLLLLAPVAAFSHPGHADGSPLLHEMSHGIHYLVALIAIGIWTAQGVGRVLRSRVLRKRSRR